MADPTIVVEDKPAAPAAAPAGTPAAAADPKAADPAAAGDADWRTAMAGDDKDMLGYLGRYQSQKAFVEAAKKDRDAVRNKQFPKLPENPSDEEVAAYRAEMGVPAAAADYMKTLPEGLLVGDDDKPFVETFMGAMHTANAPPAMVNAAVQAYYSIVEEQAAAQAQADEVAQTQATDALRQEWGADYRRNLNAMHSFLDTLPGDVAATFRHARLPVFDADGNPTGETTPIGFNPVVIEWLVSQALDRNPLARVAPGTGTAQADSVANELASLKTMMADRNSEYWKGPKADKLQARYRDLLEATARAA